MFEPNGRIIYCGNMRWEYEVAVETGNSKKGAVRASRNEAAARAAVREVVDVPVKDENLEVVIPISCRQDFEEGEAGPAPASPEATPTESTPTPSPASEPQTEGRQPSPEVGQEAEPEAAGQGPGPQ